MNVLEKIVNVEIFLDAYGAAKSDVQHYSSLYKDQKKTVRDWYFVLNDKVVLARVKELTELLEEKKTLSALKRTQNKETE